MKINQIRLKNFRNYDSCQFIPDPHMNVIIGKNAQGKTNLLESIVLLSTTRSHRAVRDQDMIREGQDFCKAECRLNPIEKKPAKGINTPLIPFAGFFSIGCRAFMEKEKR